MKKSNKRTIVPINKLDPKRKPIKSVPGAYYLKASSKFHD